jgi:UDP-glucose 4-epimerase
VTQTTLITGGFGFLGRAVAICFKQNGHRVIGIGHGEWSKEEALHHGFDYWLNEDISAANLSKIKESYDLVVHCAGNGSVGYSVEKPLGDFQKTVVSTAELLEFLRLNNPKATLIYPSSAAVYGAKRDQPIKIVDTLNPISPYGYHKKMVEEMLECYSRNYGVGVVAIRFFSIYGPGLMKQLLWEASQKFILSKSAAIFWGTGQETRDWIHIEDAAQLISQINVSPGKFFVVNGASGVRMTVEQALLKLRTALGADNEISFNGQIKQGDPIHYHADISEARALGWNPKVEFSEALESYAEWIRSVI